jgi:hypothetical protein
MAAHNMGILRVTLQQKNRIAGKRIYDRGEGGITASVSVIRKLRFSAGVQSLNRHMTLNIQAQIAHNIFNI